MNRFTRTINDVAKELVLKLNQDYTRDRRPNLPVPTSKPDHRQPKKWGGNTGNVDRAVPSLESFSPQYLYADGYRPVYFERIRWWPETREYVVVFRSEVFCTTTFSSWTERFVWAHRGDMVELKQFGTRSGWRLSREGWK